MSKSAGKKQSAKRTVTVVVPIYTLSLSAAEVCALRHTCEVLRGRDIAIIAPQGLDLESLAAMLGVEQCWRVERFDPAFFAGREGYNRLMTSTDLYERFLDSEFMLVCQTDVWIFADRLDEWLMAGYDYVGAPWLPDRREVDGRHPLRALSLRLRRALGSHEASLKFKVGNGGLSLRRTATFAQVALSCARQIESMCAPSQGKRGFEDVFWGLRANELVPGIIRVAPWREALCFAVEGHPDYALSLLGGELPMGTHAYARKRNRAHWQGLIPPGAFPA